jgi:menaquinone-dependent protoporphyrinogen oxidase
MKSVLIAYATKHGSTAEVAQFMGEVLRERDFSVTIAAAETVESVAAYDAVLVGSPIYGGMWLTETSQFLERFADALSQKPTYFWMTCIRVLEPDGFEHAQHEYVYQPLMKRIGVRDIGVFAGKLKQDEINWDDRWTLAARYDGKDLPGTRDDDFRDWNAIRAWTVTVRDMLAGG